jgi:hypothetical protein
MSNGTERALVVSGIGVAPVDVTYMGDAGDHNKCDTE